MYWRALMIKTFGSEKHVINKYVLNPEIVTAKMYRKLKS